MKIKPARAVIIQITRDCGSVLLLLGTRVDESAERAKRIRGRELTARGLNPHHEIPNALVALAERLLRLVLQDYPDLRVWGT